jgi:hypothetical protein
MLELRQRRDVHLLSDDAPSMRQLEPKMRRKKALIGIVMAIAIVTGGLLAFLGHTSSGSSATANPRTTLFSAFSTLPAASVDDRVQAIADDMGANARDVSGVRNLAGGLGRFQSRVLAFPSFDGQNICYALLAAEPTNPGMAYCYRPHDHAHAPAGLADERFSVSALESRTGPSLDVGTQVFGVAEDGVVGVRVQVAGNWQKVPIVNNSLYLDLAGVPRSDVSTVEVTLSDGTTQLHDLSTGE